MAVKSVARMSMALESPNPTSRAPTWLGGPPFAVFRGTKFKGFFVMGCGPDSMINLTPFGAPVSVFNYSAMLDILLKASLF